MAMSTLAGIIRAAMTRNGIKGTRETWIRANASLLSTSPPSPPSTSSSSSSSPHYPTVTYSRRPGTEPWHTRVTQPAAGNKLYSWPTKNDRIHPPGFSQEKEVGAYVCHMRGMVKYSPKKMWYIASLVRGLTIDEAIRQLGFVNKKGALVVREVLEEAREMAVRDHNVEHRTNLWVAESFCNSCKTEFGIKRHARGKITKVRYRYINYYVRLEEGRPPENYYEHEYKNKRPAREMLEDYVREHREKTIMW